MRYFFIAYYASNEKQVFNGNLWFENKEFPSNEYIKSIIFKNERLKNANPVITSIFEFKNKKDYLNFTKK